MRYSVASFVQALWDATRKKQRLSWASHFAFFVLCCFEKVYNLLFCVNQWLRKKRGGFEVDSFRVISVGNLTTGGTGKSVAVAFLAEYLGADSCAVLLRGYGRVNASEKNLLVSDGAHILAGVEAAGDEAIMHASKLGCTVVVGGDRKKSCDLIMRSCAKKPRYIILDDAYQNHQLKKDYEILLLDARAPFDNGHCLPAGRLREKDYGRADLIMLTHADCVSLDRLHEIKEQLLPRFLPSNIVCVKHVVRNLFCADGSAVASSFMQGRRFLVFAGIGSFDRFVKSISDLGIAIGKTVEFADHYRYDKKDVEFLLSLMHEYGLAGVLTTTKDWTKIELILKQYHGDALHKFFIAPVSIEFLSQQEYSHFITHLNAKINHII